MNREKLLVANEISVIYGDFSAITNVTMSVSANDYIGIVGPNGGGKTSLIKAILDLVPYQGKIEFFNDLREGHNIGYLPQKHNFDISFPITVTEVIMSGLLGCGSRKCNFPERKLRSCSENNEPVRHVSQLVRELMELTGIAALANKSINQISGGELQRALLCRALISNPRLLILDEPSTHVDSRFEQDLYNILAELNKRMAIIIVSHDLETISSHVKSIVCVNKTAHWHDISELTPEMLQNYGCALPK